MFVCFGQLSLKAENIALSTVQLIDSKALLEWVNFGNFLMNVYFDDVSRCSSAESTEFQRDNTLSSEMICVSPCHNQDNVASFKILVLISQHEKKTL